MKHVGYYLTGIQVWLKRERETNETVCDIHVLSYPFSSNLYNFCPRSSAGVPLVPLRGHRLPEPAAEPGAVSHLYAAVAGSSEASLSSGLLHRLQADVRLGQRVLVASER
jgi:hypothetical protein